MSAKKKKVKSKVKKTKNIKVKPSSKKKVKKTKSKSGSDSKPKNKKAKPKKTKAKRISPKISKKSPKANKNLRDEFERQGKDIFFKEKKWTFSHWFKKYSPVIITLLIGLATYFYLIFYLFYPTALLHGHYVQLLALLVFIFLIAGVLIYLGIRAELLFVRILSFIFVFVIFTFLLLFILLANTMQGLGV